MFTTFTNLKIQVSIFFHKIKVGVKNLINWLPIIWKDRDWDFAYYFDIEKKKLQNMLKFYEDSSRVVDVDTKYFKICIKLIDAILENDDYLTQTYDESMSLKDFMLNNRNYKFNHYVNLKNRHRFLTSGQYQHFTKSLGDNKLDAHIKNTIYRLKAKHLYYKILENNVLDWWE